MDLNSFDTVLLIITGVALLVVITIILFRSRSDMAVTESRVAEDMQSALEIEGKPLIYSWQTHSPLRSLAIGFLFLLLIAGSAVLFIPDLQRFLEPLYQYGLAILAVLGSFLANAFKKTDYFITDYGLYKRDAGNQGERKLVFAWEDLAEVNIDSSGFRYRLQNGRSSRILAGDYAQIVNSMVLARRAASESVSNVDYES